MFLITAGDVQERVDTAGDSAEDEEETDPRVQQKVGEVVKVFLLPYQFAMKVK